MADVRITCPECGFAKDVPGNKFPAGRIRVTCPKCSKSFLIGTNNPSSKPADNAADRENQLPGNKLATRQGIKWALLAFVGLVLVIAVIGSFAGRIISPEDNAAGGILSGLTAAPDVDSVPSIIKVTGIGGDMEAVYTKFRAALDEGDTKTMQSLMRTEDTDKLDSPLSHLGVIAMRAMVPKQVTVISASIYDNWGSLVLESEKDGGFITGTAKFVKEHGEYKIVKEEWQLVVHGSLKTGVPTMFREGEVATPTEPISAELLSSKFWPGNNVRPSAFYTADNEPRLLSTIPSRGGAVSRLFFASGITRVVYSYLSDGIVRLCDISTLSEIDQFETDNQPIDIIPTPNGDNVVIVDSAGGLSLLEVRADGFGNSTNIAANQNSKCRLAVSPNGRLLAIAGDKCVALWDINKGCRLSQIETSEPINAITFAPNGRILAAGSTSNRLSLWDLSTGQGRIYTVPEVGEATGISSISISKNIPNSHDNPYLVTGHTDSRIIIWDFSDMKKLNNIHIPGGSTSDVVFSPDGRVFASTHLNGDVYLWEPSSGEKLMTLPGQKEIPNVITFSQESNLMAYADVNGNISILGTSLSR